MDPVERETNTDIAIMRRIVAGEEAALAELYDRYGSLAFSLCFRILGDRQLAEDTVLEVFWELWEKAAAYRSERGTPRTYLLILTRSRSIDRKRKFDRSLLAKAQRDPGGRPGPDIDDSPTPPERLMWTEERKLVSDALSTLDQNQQQMLKLSFFEGLTHLQIADQLDVPLGTVKTRIRTGLIKLREKLQQAFSSREET